jgi:molybdopterin-guanine dinucleotide biosynthesis protein A
LITVDEVTGLILAGGRGSRMGGVDKGLQTLDGQTLVEHAIRRLAPQVNSIMINANRHLDVYARLGVTVWPDADAEFAGPLAGFLAGMTHCPTEWLATVPCDTPYFPLDLVARLSEGVGKSSAAIATTAGSGRSQRQPVFCLIRSNLAGDLSDYLGSGGRKIETWLDRHACVDVLFANDDAFFNANTLEELRGLGDP